MHIHPLWMLVLLLAGCSCQRTPDHDLARPTTAEAARTDTAALAAPSPDASPSSPHPAPVSAGERTTPEMTVHRYLELLLADRARADALWSGGQPAPQPDDAALRSVLVDAGSLRIITRPATPLDRDTPHRALEVSVDLRLTRNGTPLRFKGWYRVRRTLSGDDWELTSASVQAELQ